MAKMKAAVWIGPKKIELREVLKPSPKEGEVLIQSKAVGICGSDLHIYYGKNPMAKPPLIMGHEVAGVVADLGEGVKSPKVDEKVVIDTAIGCGECDYCKQGAYYQCNSYKQIGVTASDGAYAEYFVAPADNCYKITGKMSWEEAAFVDTLACPVHAMDLVHHKLGETIAVFGPGPGGLSFVQLAKLCGASKVILTGTRKERLELGKRYGVNLTINVKDEKDVAGTILNETKGTGVDLTIETSGAAGVVEQAIEVTRKQGEIIIYAMYRELANGINFQDMHRREISIYGASGAPWTYDAAISLISTGKVKVKEMITHTFKLEELKQAFRVAEERRDGYIKGIVLF